MQSDDCLRCLTVAKRAAETVGAAVQVDAIVDRRGEDVERGPAEHLIQLPTLGREQGARHIEILRTKH